MKRALILLSLCVAGCASDDDADNDADNDTAEKTPRVGSDYVTVDHILIGVKQEGLRGVNRSADEARKLAYQLLDQLENGGDWAALKRKYSDDPPPGGPYSMANSGKAPRTPDEASREGMVPGFGDVSFSLDVGQIKMADYDKTSCKWGYHIIKRVK